MHLYPAEDKLHEQEKERKTGAADREDGSSAGPCQVYDELFTLKIDKISSCIIGSGILIESLAE